MKKLFEKIQQHVCIMVQMFKKSKFFLCVAQKMNYEDGITFTENNIVQYLAELEEYISSLITYSAFKRDDPNAAISSIPLEKLNQKDFLKRAQNIDPPLDSNVQNEGDGQVDPFDIISSKELYAKFMDLVEKKEIHFVTHGTKG